MPSMEEIEMKDENDTGASSGENQTSGLRHFPRRAIDGAVYIVDRQFNFVRAILPYSYAYSSNAQQWDEAARICQALEGPMSALGVARVSDGSGAADETGTGSALGQQRGPEGETPREIVYAWIRDHAPLTVKMNTTREQSDRLIEAVATAIRDAERAAYERAAEVCNGENAAWREMWDGQPIYYACAGAIRALIDKEPT
jgi:hypothetical protein